MATERDDDFNRIGDSLRRIEDYVGELESERAIFAKDDLPLIRRVLAHHAFGKKSPTALDWYCIGCERGGGLISEVSHKPDCSVGRAMVALDKLEVD